MNYTKNILIFAGLGLFSYFLIINFTDFSPEVATILFSRGALVYTMLAFVLLGLATVSISEWVNRRYIQSAKGQRRLLVVNTLVAVIFLAFNYGACVLAKLIADVQPVWHLSASGWRVLAVLWMAEMTIILLLLSNRALKANQTLRQEAARLQIENAEARYYALQSQLNPHFLFNSLNTLIAEIKYNPENAVSFTRHLSNVYRYVLQCHDRHLVALAEELTFVQSYIFLHQVRLGDCLRCEVDVPDDCLDYELPPLTLQLLVENVIKHNSISLSKPMVVRIKVEGDNLKVSHPLSPKKTPSAATSHVGLKNLSKRCKIVCNRDITIQNGSSTFAVTVPLVK